MTTYFNRAGATFDDLFEPDPEGVTIPGFYASNGTTLLKYAPLSKGEKIANVEHYHGSGPDVTNYWAGKGTVRYVTPVIPFGYMNASWTYNARGVTFVQITMMRDGRWQMMAGAYQENGHDYPTAPNEVRNGTWYPDAPSNIGDQYDVRFTATLNLDTGNFTHLVTNEATTWTRLDASRTVRTQVSGRPTSNVASYDVTIEIRQRSNGQIVSSSFSNFNHTLVYL